MIRELRKLRAKGGRERAVANYISQLQHRGLLTKQLSAKGYAAYDTEELKEYRKTARRGRPCKTEITLKKEIENND